MPGRCPMTSHDDRPMQNRPAGRLSEFRALTATHCSDDFLDTGYLGAPSLGWHFTCVIGRVSEVDTMTTGVSQGTVRGPLLFNAYIAPLTKLLQKQNVHHHLDADDTQLYITFPPTDHTHALPRMEACVQDANTWLYDNGHVKNENKSQAIVICSPSLRTPPSLSVGRPATGWPADARKMKSAGCRGNIGASAGLVIMELTEPADRPAVVRPMLQFF